MPKIRLAVRKLGRFWWITGDEDDGPYGPYDTKKEAEQDRKGIIRSMRDASIPAGKKGSWAFDTRGSTGKFKSTVSQEQAIANAKNDFVSSRHGPGAKRKIKRRRKR